VAHGASVYDARLLQSGDTVLIVLNQSDYFDVLRRRFIGRAKPYFEKVDEKFWFCQPLARNCRTHQPNATAIISRVLSDAVSRSIDAIAFDPNAGDATRPPGLRNGATSVTPASGTSEWENTQDDLAEMLGAIALQFGNRSRAAPMFSLNLMPENSSVVAAAGLGSSRKNVAAGSQRFVFAGFRRRTPGPPPLSSMNSTPAFSKARLTTSRVARRGWLPSFSNWWMVIMPTPARSAKFCWLQLSKPLAALHWADVIIPQSSATR
jgi:hypothetical protein